MKISKTLITSITAGILALSTTSCEKEPIENTHLETCDEHCTADHAKSEGEANPWDNCPACGMG